MAPVRCPLMIKERLQRLRHKEVQRLWALILGGKMIGILAILGVMKGAAWYFDSAAGAIPSAPAHTANELINPLNTVWVLVTAFLVFFMQAGFMALEAGFARSRETVNVLLECIVDTCLCGLLFWAFGFAFMFGAGNGFIGLNWFFLSDVPATYESTGVSF